MVGGSIKSYLLKRVSTVRIRPGAPEEYRARYRLGAGLFWSKGRIRAVDTRVTNFPAGGVFESARGHQRNIEPGTASVPGSSGLRAGFEPSTPASPISPRGEFSNPPGGTRGISSSVPLRCRALLVLELRRSMLTGRIKSKAPACRGSKRALLSEYVCGVRCADNKQPASWSCRNRRLNQYQSQKPKPSA